MPEIKLNRQAAENGQLPNVCLCCGAPSTHLVNHRFYLRSTGILIAMLLLGKMRWLFLPQSYEYSELRVPLCGFHRHRLHLHWYLLVGFAVLGLLCVPVLLLGSINKDYLWVTEIGLVAFLLLFPVMFFTVLIVMLLTPRMVEHSNMSVKLVSVSAGFAQALLPAALQPGRSLPGLPGKAAMSAAGGGSMFAGFSLQLGLITAGVLALSLLEGGMIVLGSSLLAGNLLQTGPRPNQPVLASNNPALRDAERRRREFDERVRQQMEESRRKMEELNRRVQPPPSPATPSQPAPSSDPDDWENVRRWKTNVGSEIGRGRLIGRSGDWITVTYKRGSLTRQSRLLLHLLSAEDQAFVRQQFPDDAATPSPSVPPIPSSRPFPSAPPSPRDPRPGDKLSPTNRNNTQFVPRPNGTKPGFAITDPSQAKPGDRVQIFWGGAWYPGSVLGPQAGLIKVSYDNHDSSWDELASLARVRTEQPVAASGSDNSRPATPAPPAFTPAAPSPPVPVPVPPPAAADGKRTWTDSTGKYTIEGVLYGVEGSNVKIERADGKIVTMPIDKLSAADQAIVRAKYP
jgi:hypothetical protein